MAHQVYILHSEELGRFYIGFTSDLEKRLAFHLDPEPRKFTYRAGDWQIFFTIDCMCERQGRAIEKHIKRMKSKVYINNLKLFPGISLKLLEKYSSDC